MEAFAAEFTNEIRRQVQVADKLNLVSCCKQIEESGALMVLLSRSYAVLCSMQLLVDIRFFERQDRNVIFPKACNRFLWSAAFVSDVETVMVPCSLEIKNDLQTLGELALLLGRVVKFVHEADYEGD